LELSLTMLNIDGNASQSGNPSSSSPLSNVEHEPFPIFVDDDEDEMDIYRHGSCYILAHIASYVKVDFGCIDLLSHSLYEGFR